MSEKEVPKHYQVMQSEHPGLMKAVYELGKTARGGRPLAVLQLKLLIAMAGKRFTERLSCKCQTTGAELF